jgi:WD40 repeat protein
MNKAFRLIIFLFIVLASHGSAQDNEFNHAELDWYTIKTAHFQVHFHNGSERTARVVAKVAEDVYGPVTTLYNFRPDGIIHFIIKDYDDNSNGAAFYYDNKVEIWAPKMTFILRGTHNWLRNVVTHEFTHMISLGASRKMTRKIPAFYMQYFGYEPEKRPDVLYGYPHRIASYPVPMTVVPMWLAEGMAQFQAPGLYYDQWDSHRDMLIRTVVHAGKTLSFSEMGVFGKTSLGNERTYNSGYAFTRYLAKRYGPASLKTLAEQLAKPWRFTVDGALKNISGMSGTELYKEWQAELAKYYSDRLQTILAHRVEGTVLTPKGIGNTFPSWSPDGRQLAYCGSRSDSYLTLTNLYLYDAATQKSKLLKTGVHSQLSWAKDGKRLVYSRIERGRYGSHYSDLYVYDLQKKKEKQLTRQLRALDPDWAPDGTRIVCIVQKDGTDNLAIYSLSGAVEKLTNNENGEGLCSPRWSPDGRFIVFSQARNHGRDLVLYNLQDKTSTALVANEGDARDPAFSPDGSKIYFSWDRTGIFNIYSIRLDGTERTLWTNVLGGAFMATVSPEGRLAFSNFKYEGYKIAQEASPTAVAETLAEYRETSNGTALAENDFAVAHPDAQLQQAKEYDDRTLPDVEIKSYEMTYGQVSLLPRALVDYNTLKLGTYFYAADIINRYSMFGGVTLNSRKDLDAFAIFEMRKWSPTLFVELYGFTRNIKRDIEVIEDYPDPVQVGIGFNILEADIGGYYSLNDHQTVRLAYSHARYTSKIKDFLFKNQKWVSPQNTYYVGNHFTLTWNYNKVAHSPSSTINPFAGRRIEVKYNREYNDFFSDFATNNDYGTLQEIYSPYNYNRIEMNWHEYWPMPWSMKHALTLNLQAGYVDRPVDSFFNFFAGGLPGLRGYPFYSIEGRKLMVGRFTYRFPLLGFAQKRLLHLTSDRVYLAAFMDYGNAFDGRLDWNAFKKDVGVNVRVSAFSFYGFPTAFSLEAAYGLDTVYNQNVHYGKEWRYYATLLFDFID